jgi:hypothetical protein
MTEVKLDPRKRNPLSLRVTDSLYEALWARSEAEGRSMSQIAHRALEQQFALAAGGVPDHIFRIMLNLMMVGDPWPLTEKEGHEYGAFLIAEAQKRGFAHWIDAYHKFKPA